MAKAAWLSLNYVSPSNAEGASPVTDHIKYIGQESDGGVDLTHTQRDIEAAVGTDLSEHEALIKYISERPGVDAQGEAHGLWGKDGVADIDATIKEIEGLENAVHYRGVFSLNRATSQEIGVEEKEQWQRHTEAAMKKTAEKLGIDYEDFEWRAAFHNASDQNPHVHIVFWDGKDRPTERIGSYGEPGHIPKEMLKSIRADWTKEFYGIYRNQIFEQKGAARDASLMIAKGLTTGAESMTTVKSEDLTELVKDFEKLSKMMPGTGRTAYKYMSPFVKAQCDVVVGKLMDHPLIKEEVDTYVSNHVELSRHHGDDVVVHLRHNIKQTAKEISAKELLKGASDKEVDLFISALQQAKIYEKTSLKLISGATGGDLSESSVLERYVAIKDLRKPLVSLSGNSEWWALRSKLDVADVDRQEGSLDRAAAWARGDLEERMRSSVLQGAKACQGELMVDEIARLTPLVRSAGSLRDASEAEMLMYARLLGTTDISDAECVASLFEASGETLSIEEAKDLLALARTKSSPPTIKDWREWKFKEGILRHSRYVTEGKTLSKGSDIETYVRALKTAGVEKENIF
ncbi:MAG: hypothetical protein FWE48_05370, partial [Coriobacteriia bacterium]|nr:hypothetical protein [Coriobacteriia bacterium]